MAFRSRWWGLILSVVTSHLFPVLPELAVRVVEDQPRDQYRQSLARCLRERPPIRHRSRATNDGWCEEIELVRFAPPIVASTLPLLHGHLPDSPHERDILHLPANSALPFPSQLQRCAPPSAALPRQTAQPDSRGEPSRLALACILPDRTSTAAAPTSGPEPRHRGCTVRHRPSSSRRPDKSGRCIRSTDARGTRPPVLRSCGRSVVV